MTPTYRAVLEPAVVVIAVVILLAILTKERKTIHKHKGGNLREVVAFEKR